MVKTRDLQQWANLKRLVEDNERDACWLLQHGHEEGQTREQITAGCELLNDQRRKLLDRTAELENAK
jgi:hypothetical protein